MSTKRIEIVKEQGRIGMKKYEVNYHDYTNGATSAIDIIEVADDYTVEDYIRDCERNMDEPWDAENGEIIFIEIED